MDIIHRQEKYQEYLKKLASAKGEVNDSMTRRSINDKIESILSEVKSRRDAGEYNIIIWLLITPFLIVSIISIIKFGIWRIIPLVLLTAYYIYYRMTLISSMKTIKANQIFDETGQINNSIIKSKIQYLLSGIDMKVKRVQLVRLMYTLFFPILVVLFIEVIYGHPLFGNLWIALVVSFAICGTYWWLYFIGEIEDLKYTQDDLSNDMGILDDPNFTY